MVENVGAGARGSLARRRYRMDLFVRLIRALWVFGLIFLSYMIQLGMTQLLGIWERDPATGRDRRRLPRWLHRRGKRVDEVNARRLLRATLRLRGVYIKLGQVLSIMGGFLPRVYTKELEALQDQVPPQPFHELEDTFFEDFGRRPDELYARIEEEPIAAASLGQVHEAWLEDGTKAAVKVLYPGIREVIRVDMRVLRLAIVVYKWFFPVQNIERVGDALVDLLHRETEYLHEAEMMERMAANFAHAKDMLFPEVVHELTTRNVLTMTFMEGLKINRVEEMPERGIDPHAVAVRLVETFYEQLFVHRLFHADPHPGNFLVQPGRKPSRPKIVVLDFGAISEVRQEMVDGMVEVLQGVFDEDRERLLRGFYQMGFVSHGANRELLERTVNTYFQKLLNIQDRTPGALMRANQQELEALADPEVARDELRELMKSVDYPEGWFYVERASVLMFWLVGTIDPDVDAMRIGFPYVMPLLMQKRAEAGAS
ncbi:MAG TPA: AarF/UbiB family protein [Sandaracinaceae bacterium LLY-WYZ-13_1]|nr:AarF/UbiB family protein [Sandaracinaceae bacterium LLY-WYZ-13_1]